MNNNKWIKLWNFYSQIQSSGILIFISLGVDVIAENDLSKDNWSLNMYSTYLYVFISNKMET